MSLNNLDLKKLYYYAICIMAFFVLMWGTVDLVSSSAGLLNIGAAPSLTSPPGEGAMPPEKGEQLFDSYYQKKMLMDRFWDSLARMLVSGLIFAYCRFTVNKLEKQS
jgi:hypothetical protein